MTMPTIDELLEQGAPPVIAILRGVRPDEVVAIGRALVAAGVRLLAEALGHEALIGAGTVLSPEAVGAVADIGGSLIVTPNTDPEVIARAVALRLDIMPGFATPSEAFAAIRAGARHLKLFPAATLGTGYLKAVREVLPATARVWAVGGTDSGAMGEWLRSGAMGIGIGSALYRPGDRAEDVAHRVRILMEAWQTL